MSEQYDDTLELDELDKLMTWDYSNPLYSGEPEEKKDELPASTKKCTCGTEAVMGKVELEYHSEWCDLHGVKRKEYDTSDIVE